MSNVRLPFTQLSSLILFPTLLLCLSGCFGSAIVFTETTVIADPLISKTKGHIWVQTEMAQERAIGNQKRVRESFLKGTGYFAKCLKIEKRRQGPFRGACRKLVPWAQNTRPFRSTVWPITQIRVLPCSALKDFVVLWILCRI
jgi:hypothetical protein